MVVVGGDKRGNILRSVGEVLRPRKSNLAAAGRARVLAAKLLRAVNARSMPASANIAVDI